MKKKILFIILFLITSLFVVNFNKTKANSITASDIVNEYYNGGVYTKKTQMFLTGKTVFDFREHFHVNSTMNRTTYYCGDYLLMGDLDGGFVEVNSGFRTEGTDIKHFTYQNGEVIDDYTVSGTNIHDYFVMLDDMMVEGYFDDFTYIIDGKYTYEVKAPVSGVETKLHDFLWFTAPGLEDSIFNNQDSSNYFSQEGIL